MTPKPPTARPEMILAATREDLDPEPTVDLGRMRGNYHSAVAPPSGGRAEQGRG